MSKKPVCNRCGNWWLQLKRDAYEADSLPTEYAFCLLCGWRKYRVESPGLTYRIRSPAIKGYGSY
jgi:hypothetical protein